jgi:hypothetical protein
MKERFEDRSLHYQQEQNIYRKISIDKPGIHFFETHNF